jgi:hypothetical protein
MSNTSSLSKALYLLQPVQVSNDPQLCAAVTKRAKLTSEEESEDDTAMEGTATARGSHVEEADDCVFCLTNVDRLRSLVVFQNP